MPLSSLRNARWYIAQHSVHFDVRWGHGNQPHQPCDLQLAPSALLDTDDSTAD
jgi:hypothetical protein